jgi:hypothetical protein
MCALSLGHLPFVVVSMDGKYVTVPSVDGRCAQRSSRSDTSAVTSRIGTITASLCSSEARPCIDVYVIPAATNEMALDALLEAYGNLDLFRLITYDAGACSKSNADQRRREPWHILLTRIRDALLLATAATFDGLRRRAPEPCLL